MAKKRVDIELDEEVLKWAAIQAAINGMSRRQFITELVVKQFNNSKGIYNKLYVLQINNSKGK